MKANNHFHLYEGWKKSLLKLVSEFDDTEVKFWNFSDSSEYLYEQVPKPGVKTRELQWFWEPAHYKKELGDLMVQTMLADQCDISSYF